MIFSNARRNYLVSETSYDITKYFSEDLLAIEMKKKTQIFMSKPVYLGLSILETSKILLYKFWYDYVKPKYGKKAKLCSMNTGSFIVFIKTETFSQTLQKVFKQYLTIQMMN